MIRWYTVRSLQGLTLFREIMVIYSVNHKNSINVPGKIKELLNVKGSDTRNYYFAWRG